MIIRGHKELGYRILRWRITNQCNYDCSYCFQKHSNEYVTDYVDILNILNIKLPLLKIPTALRLSGGEPTVHPEFDIMLQHIKVPFGIYTNLSLSIDKLFTVLSHPFLHHIYCSLHIHQCTDLSKFFDKIQLIIEHHNIKLYIAVMLETSSNIDEILEYLTSFNINGYIIPKIIENSCGVVDRNYYDGFDLAHLRKYLISQQLISYGAKSYYRFDNYKKHVFTKPVLCDINKYQLELTGGRVQKCLLNDKQFFSIDAVPLTQVCHNFNNCHIFTWEFGTKKW